ncbi:MAG TPA: hypothetical protein VLF18_03635 [Tahibacter sp.]|uniref:hypothetical protein n=1 Tax=Tahibacter sp. TaxID=2056211 RepID=UPI002C726BDB|nr:hypothetical protein [Tahibacter sp.]HSX59273.1 hypothetical protein [Tahibacter sp.]
MQPQTASPNVLSSVLGTAGGAAMTVARHVPTRAVLWALGGFLLGLLAVGVSLLLARATLGGAAAHDGGAAAMLHAGRYVVLLLVPLVGLVAFGAHGFQRGLAHATLALEAQWGLVVRIVDTTIAQLDQQVGPRLANLPLAQAETTLKAYIRRALGDENNGRRGLAGWVLRTLRATIVGKVETWLLSAYRAEVTAQGGGGIDLTKLRDRVVEEVGAHLRESLLGSLNFQLVVLLVLFVGLGAGWFHLALAVVSLTS